MGCNHFVAEFLSFMNPEDRDADRAALVPLRACLIKHAFAKAMAVNKRKITSQYGGTYFVNVT